MKHWLAIRDLLADALERPAAERVAYLRARGGDLDPAALAEAERYLRAASAEASAGDDRLSAPAGRLAADVATEAAAPALPERFGPWRRRGLLGEGGMGSVYLAERADGAFERTVALKLVRSSAEIGRREVQAVARLEHPHIARLYDAGEVEVAGRPVWYFAMERIEGTRIDEALRGRPPRQRLDTFISLCRAVAYAHAHGLLHGDLKADNVLVDEAGAPHVIDFGIAQLTRVGGVGEFGPIGSAQAGPAETARAVAPADPTQIAHQRDDVTALGRLLGELTADLPPDPGWRAVIAAATAPTAGRGETGIATADQLAAEVARLRRGGVPHALRGHVGYRLRAGARRYRWALAAAAVLLLGLGTLGWQRTQTTALAASNAAQSGTMAKVAERLIEDVHESVNGMQGNVRARERVLAEAIAILDGLGAQRHLDARTAILLAHAYYKIGYVQGIISNPSLGDRTAAAVNFGKGLKALDALPPATDPRDTLTRDRAVIRARLLDKLGAVLAHSGQADSGRTLIDSARAVLAKAVPYWPGDGDVGTHLGSSLINVGDYAGHPYFPNLGDTATARRMYEEAEAALQAIHPAERTPYTDRLQALTFERRGTLSRESGDYPAAERAYLAAIAFQRALIERGNGDHEAHRDLVIAKQSLGTVYVEAGEPARALPYFDTTLAFFRARVLADPADMGALADLGHQLHHRGDAYAAIAGAATHSRASYREALAAFREVAAADTSATRPRELVASLEAKLAGG